MYSPWFSWRKHKLRYRLRSSQQQRRRTTIFPPLVHKLPPVVILRLRNMTALDATGLFAMEEVARALQGTGRTLILCGAREQPAKLLHEAEFEEVIGKNNICENVQDAVERAQDVFEKLEANAVLGGK